MIFQVLLIAVVASSATAAMVRPYQIDFVLSARDLFDENYKTPSAYAVISYTYNLTFVQSPPVEIGRTTFLNSQRHPDWQEVFRCNWFYPTVYPYNMMNVKVEVFSHNPKTSDTFIGWAQFDPNTIFQQFGNRLKLTLKRRDGKYGARSKGDLVVRGRKSGSTEEIADERFVNPKQIFKFP